MAWSTLCLLVLGGVLLPVALRAAGAASERARGTRGRRRPPSWSEVGDLAPFVCQRCGALNLISGAGVGPEGVAVRCTQCHARDHVHPPPRPLPAAAPHGRQDPAPAR